MTDDRDPVRLALNVAFAIIVVIVVAVAVYTRDWTKAAPGVAIAAVKVADWSVARRRARRLAARRRADADG
jgi:hypothetical protein